jgi:hypothetical protein
MFAHQNARISSLFAKYCQVGFCFSGAGYARSYCFCHCVENKENIMRLVKYWEIIADNLSKAGWSWGCVSALIPTGEQSSSQTRMAATESVSLCMRMKS